METPADQPNSFPFHMDTGSTFNRMYAFISVLLFTGGIVHLIMGAVGHPYMWIQLASGVLSLSLGLFVLRLSRTSPTLRGLTFEQLNQKFQASVMQLDTVRSRIDHLVRQRQYLQRLYTERLLKEHRERRRLATDFHDDLMQLLVVCRLKATHGGRRAPDETREVFLDLQHLVDQCLKHARKLTVEISPTALLPSGLQSAIRHLTAQMEGHGLIVTVKSGGTDMVIHDDLTLVIYQIVRELLFNVLKHAHVQDAVLQFQKHHDHELIVTVRDHGVGFDTKTLEDTEKNTFGLFSISEQLTALGGRFSVESTIGAGTVATLAVPLIYHPSSPVGLRNGQVPPHNGSSAVSSTKRMNVHGS